MEYILNDRVEGIDFGAYSEYVESIKDRLPGHVYAFASGSQYFDLSSPSTLHDAWLESLVIRENATGERKQIRRTEIDICLLGAFHDRRIRLHYTEVSGYSMTLRHDEGNSRWAHTAHGDLFTHEIRLGNGGFLIHELLFEEEARIVIEGKDIRHSEELIA